MRIINYLKTLNFKKTAVKALAIVLIFVACDLLLGYLFIPKAYFDIFYLRNLHPYYNHGFNANREGQINYGPITYRMAVNSLGMKDATMRTVKLTNPGKKRILFIGDSFTEGIGYTYEQTFCGQLAGRLDTAKYEILNAGVASYDTKLYFLKLKYLFEIEKLKVDEVYCFADFSDMGDALIYRDFEPELATTLSKARYDLNVFLRSHSILTYLTISARQNLFLKNIT